MLKLLLLCLCSLCLSEKLTPISSCTKGRITRYTGWEQGGSCSFGPHTHAVGEKYMYPISPNQALYNNQAQCGICYEMVGPYGVIRARVENYCPAGDADPLCKGDMFHFDTAHNGSQYLMKDLGVANITFRMVACDFEGNIRIRTGTTATAGWYNFVVLDHRIGVKSVRAKQKGSDEWTNLVRENSNQWTYYIHQQIQFPITIEIYSINGDYVTVKPPSAEANKIYEADGNFKVPNDLWFDVESLSKVKKPSPSEGCCERDKKDFTPIYKDGFKNGGYEHLFQNAVGVITSAMLYNGQQSIEVVYQGFGRVIMHTDRDFPIRADQYLGVKFALYPTEVCNSCLYVRAYDLQDKNQILSFNASEINKWKEFYFDFKTLGVTGEFKGIIFQYFKATTGVRYYIADVELEPNPNAPDAGVCFEDAEIFIENIGVFKYKMYLLTTLFFGLLILGI